MGFSREKPDPLKPAERRHAKVQPAGISRGVIMLHGDVRSDHGEVAEVAAERRGLGGGGGSAGAKHQINGFPAEPDDLLLDLQESAVVLVGEGNVRLRHRAARAL